MPSGAIAWTIAAAAALGWSLFDLTRRFLVGRMSTWALVVWVTVGALPLILAWGLAAGDWRLGSGYLAPGLASVALNVVANFAYFRSLQLSPLSVTLPLLSLTPVFSAVLGGFVLGERIGARAWLGIALVVVGAALLSTVRSAGSPAGFRIESGSLLMGLVALCWSVTLLLDKMAVLRASAPVHALVLNAGVAAGGLLALAGTGRLGELAAIRGSWLRLLATVACGAAALTSQLYAIQRLPIGLVETLKRGVGGTLAVVWGRAFFAEAVTLRKLVSVALLGAGVGLLLL